MKNRLTWLKFYNNGAKSSYGDVIKINGFQNAGACGGMDAGVEPTGMYIWRLQHFEDHLSDSDIF